ncbi:MAG: hypothetical protein HOO06_01855 [Bdellovibrionaceae bacterium]|jgi:hypothetical protein|nr:hypothetical protein [Pseudobdellovibrionaceae bacterium]
MKKLLEFLLGKKPPIFNKDGAIEHPKNPRQWELWRKRYTSEAGRNWRNHAGVRAKEHR